MQIHIRLITPDIIIRYKLNNISDKNGWIYMEIIRVMYGLPQAGILANNLPAQRLGNHGCYQVKNLPVLWLNSWISISFTLVVDNFGIGYIGQEHADHLMSALIMYYEKLQ